MKLDIETSLFIMQDFHLESPTNFDESDKEEEDIYQLDEEDEEQKISQEKLKKEELMCQSKI
jgi:hypothetical protein